MKILVTGSSGYIGSHIMHKVQALQGVEVVSLNTRLHALNPGSLETNLVIHCAGALRNRPAELFSSNAEGMQHLLTAIPKDTPVICLSSRSVYGIQRRGFVKENDPPNPDDDYGLSKWQGENFLQSSGHPHVILRLTGVVGAGVRSLGYCFPDKALETFHQYGQVELVREDAGHQYICVEDVAKVVARLITDQCGWNETYHVAGELRSLHSLIGLMQMMTGKGAIRFIDRTAVPDLVLSNEKTDLLMGGSGWRMDDQEMIRKALSFLDDK